MAGSFLTPNFNAASGASFSKRKRQSWTSEDFEYEQSKHLRIRSPKFDRRATFPTNNPPELVADNQSNPNSDSDDHDQDQDQDQSMDVDMDMDMNMDQTMEEGSASTVRDYDAGNYAFGQSGSGGFGFGPGAEEDDEDLNESIHYPQVKVYPSLTKHSNPNHFSNLPNGRPASPFNAQPFSTTLRAPSPARGLLQPSINQTLSASANDIEKARNQHGPNCKRIPKLVLSQFPDPLTGQRSMWTVCEDCGACERAA